MDFFSVGEGRYKIVASVQQLDSGINITLTGGEYTHIGSVVIAIPRPSLADPQIPSATSSIFNLVGHKDDELAKPFAEKLAKTTGQVVVVTAGVHIEQATNEDILLIKENTELLIKNIVATITK